MERILYEKFHIPREITDKIWAYCIKSKMIHIARYKKYMHIQLLEITKGIYCGLEMNFDKIRSCKGNGLTYVHWYMKPKNELTMAAITNDDIESCIQDAYGDPHNYARFIPRHNSTLDLLMIGIKQLCDCPANSLYDDVYYLPQYISRLYGNTKWMNSFDKGFIHIFIEHLLKFYEKKDE